MELEVPQRPHPGLHCPLSWFNVFCGERGKSGSLIANVRDHGKEMLCLIIFSLFSFFWLKICVVTRKEEETIKHIYQKIKLKQQHIHFLVHGLSFGPL